MNGKELKLKNLNLLRSSLSTAYSPSIAMALLIYKDTYKVPYL